MTNELKNVPELRFLEFDGEWEEKKLMQIAKVKTGTKNVQDNIANGAYKFFDRSVEIKYLNTFDFDETAIIYPGEGSKFLPRFFSGKYSLHQRAYSIFDVKINNYYLFYYLSLQNNHFLKYAVGSTVKSLRMSGFEKLKVLIPEIDEQKKIGEFFSKLDRQIELEEQKLAKLEEQKKGYMQKIFSQELRFKDENGNEYPEWESKKIEELFNLIDGDRGKNYPSDKDFYDKGHTLFLDTGNVTKNGFLFNKNRFINKEKDDILRNGKLELNDFVITSRGTLGNIGFYGQNIHHKYPNIRINSAMLILRPLNNKFNYQYLYFLLKDDAIDTFMKHYRVGSAQPHITKKDFGNMKISVITDVNEQRKIAKSLTTLDKLVINQSNKVESLKQRKQGLLQKMFI